MPRRRNLTFGIALAATAILALSGCASGGGDAGGGETPAGDEYGLVAAGTLTMCSDIPYEPFEYEDSSTETGYTGFDVELVSAIAKKLDLKLAVQDVSFEALTSGTVLVAGDCDLGASAMTITDERKANLDFSDSYYDSLQSLLVRADSGIKSIEDLDGKTVGVQQGTTGETYTTDNAPKSTEIIRFASDGELWPAIQAGQVDAILQDLPVNLSHENADSAYKIVEQYDTKESYGFAFAKGEKDTLIEAVNKALKELNEDGTYQELYDTYLVAD